MCGIAGIVASDQRSLVDPAIVRRMCDCIVHRGPDDQGLWRDRNAALGMRRLSIIDIAGGRQPIHNEDHSVIAVFNGEIYNFAELRDELELRGHTFCSDTDSEVIVHLYEDQGSELVHKLRGMFAFALYDTKLDTLLLARDRLGKKPLHYALRNGTLYFGSEVKSLIAAEPSLADVNESALLQYFQYGYILDPGTAFKAIRKLPPGHLLEFSKGSLRMHRYWDVPQFAILNLPEQECLERMEQVLTDAVRMRLISDVPLGALLSGGVDSSVIVALMARVSNAPVKTFSISFGEPDFDESAYARSVARKFATEHHEFVVEPQLWDTLLTLTGIMDEPFADSSIIPTYHVSRLARQFVTVVLSGDGGDELFGGYDRYSTHLQRRFLDSVPAPIRSLYRQFVYPAFPKSIQSRKLAYNAVLPAADRYIDGMCYITLRDADLLSSDFLDATREDSSLSVMRHYFDGAPARDLLSRMQYTDIKTYLAADILTKVDRMSMAASLEARAPLLDHLFVEFAAALPVRMKIRGNTRKYILRKLAQRLGVPSEVLYRRKKGFAMPLVHWMRREMRKEIAAVLLESRTLQRGYLERRGIERLLREHDSGERDHSAVIWQMLMFELWHRNFLEPARVASSRRIDNHEYPSARLASCPA